MSRSSSTTRMRRFIGDSYPGYPRIPVEGSTLTDMACVLVLEPEPDLRRLAQEALAELGHEAVLDPAPGQGSQVDVVLVAPCPGMKALIDSLRGARGSVAVVSVGGWPLSEELRALRPGAHLVAP